MAKKVQEKEYNIHTTKDEFLCRVDAVDLTDATEKVKSLWPVKIKAKHLTYNFVLCDQNGTLDFTEGKIPIRD